MSPAPANYRPRHTTADTTQRVATRVAPTPVASGISFRKLPAASIEQISRTCDHWLGKAQGSYEHPANRHLFELVHELKALIEPMRAEEARKDQRLAHLEEVLLQWNEVFRGPGFGELASPAALAKALLEYKALNERLGMELHEARTTMSAQEEHFKAMLAQHHDAWAACQKRLTMRHAEEIARVRDLHAQQLRMLSVRAPDTYAATLEAAAVAASQAQHRSAASLAWQGARMLASLALLLPSMLPDSARLTSARSRSGNPSMGVLDDVDSWLTKNVGPIAKKSGVGGGSGWSTCTRYAIEGSDRELFVKASGSRNLESMFLGEALGLKALGVSGSLAIPEVLHYADGTDAGSYIIMEYLDIGGRPDPEAFGRAMASLHLAEPRDEEARAGKFGFPVDNTIGATPQPNTWTDDWVEFFREKRIGHQVRLARDARMRKEWERTLEATDGLKTLFEGINVKPSVLHGDLWSGNIAAVDGKPCIYDPAVYYGHHEAEWGMSWCASLPPAFWKGYRELIPEDEGFRKRSNLYELYHKLNHYNLFGGGYYNDALGLMSSLDD